MTDIRRPTRRIGNAQVVSFWAKDAADFINFENRVAKFYNENIKPLWGDLTPEQQEEMKKMLANIEEIERLVRRKR